MLLLNHHPLGRSHAGADGAPDCPQQRASGWTVFLVSENKGRKSGTSILQESMKYGHACVSTEDQKPGIGLAAGRRRSTTGRSNGVLNMRWSGSSFE